MKKEGRYRKVHFIMQRGNGYGLYNIVANYKGKDIITITHDSEAWDYLDDDVNKEKQLEARKHCYYKIVSMYEHLLNS